MARLALRLIEAGWGLARFWAGCAAKRAVRAPLQVVNSP